MKKVSVVLTQNVKGLGFVGDQIEVKPGYARNFLIPRGVAVEQELANKFKKLAERLKKEREEAIASSRQLSNMLSGLTLTFEKKVQEKGSIFGSIGSLDIVKALSEKMISIPDYAVKLTSPIKTLGKHTVAIKLHSEVITHINVQVIEEGRKDPPQKRSKRQEKQEESKTQKAGNKAGNKASNKKDAKFTAKQKKFSKASVETKTGEATPSKTSAEKTSASKTNTVKTNDVKSSAVESNTAETKTVEKKSSKK